MQHLRPAMAVVSLLSLSGCGGGAISSAGTQPAVQATAASAGAPASTSAAYAAAVAPPKGYVVTPDTMQPMRSVNDTAEYRTNFVAAEMVSELYALDHGWRGQGVTVGVLDDGVNTALPAFQGQVSALSKDFGYVTTGGVRARRDVLGDDQSDHGTAAAAIIAARADGSGTMGMAPDAKIAVLRTSDYDTDTRVETMGHDADALDYASSAGLKVVNRSLVSNGAGLGEAVARYGATGGLLVNAAGNGGLANPADAVNVTAANRDAWLFVVALAPDLKGYAIASYSNRVGSLADRTVAAIGTNVTVAVDGSTTLFSGTSAATPQVTALAALILSKWPQLSGKDAGAIILDTARDIGDPGMDAVYGHGLIDVAAALAPAQPTISNGSTSTALADSVMALPAAIGAGSVQAALSNVTVLDAYGRDFTGSVASLVVHPEDGRSRWLRQRVARMAGAGSSRIEQGPFTASFGFAHYRTGPNEGDTASLLTSGEMAYRAGATRVRASVDAQDSLQRDVMGLAPFADGILAYAPQAGNSIGIDRLVGRARLGMTITTGSLGRSRAQAATLSFDVGGLSLRGSWIDETGSVLGAVSSGGLALASGARTAVVEAHQVVGVAGGWTLEGYGSVGATWLTIDPGSVVTGASSLLGTRMGVQVAGPAFGGVASVGVAQPLTIERGRAHLTVGSGYDLATRSLTYGSVDADLAGGRRHLQLTGGFARTTGAATLRLGVMQDVADGTRRLLGGYRRDF